MSTEIIVNVHSYEKRVAILEDHELVELFAEKKEQNLLVGNIYKGVVKNVLPGMGAAFIDLKLSRTAFLHFRDIDINMLTPEKKKIFRQHNSSTINKILKPGDEIIVQVKKDPLGKKGARVTCKLSLPGKFLVLRPKINKILISRRIRSMKEKKRIKKILKELKKNSDGLIVRTDTEGTSKEDFKQEYNGLNRTMKLIQKQAKYAKAPCVIYDENDLSLSLIRDLFSTKVDRLVVDDQKLLNKIKNNLSNITPELLDRIELYQESTPIFNAFGIEKEIEKIFHSKVKLPSGGNIKVQQTEALVAIDVNTGSFTGKNNYHDTIRITNMEAAKEIARQIRLRDLSGIMVVDFIDMKDEKHKEEVFQKLKNLLRNDRAKSFVYPFSPLGLVEISRKRTRPSLLLTYSEQCPHCNGTGRLLSRDSVAVRISRWLMRAKFFIKNEPLLILVHPKVKVFISDHPDLFENIDNKFKVESDGNIKFDQFQVFLQKSKKEITHRYNT